MIKWPDSLSEFSIADRLDKCKNKKELKYLLRQADIGITDVLVREIELSEDQTERLRKVFKILSNEDEEVAKHMKQLDFMHSAADGKPKALDYDSESQGTQTFLNFLLPALEGLSEGSFLVIDELDTSLHPDLSRAFLSLFHRKTSNPHGAQLLFSTHDVTLLDSDILQQDEI